MEGSIIVSRYITTSGEFNQLIPTYSDGDDVYIQDGAIATMAHSPNFRIDSIFIQEGELIIDSANGTAPIHIPHTNYIYAYPGAKLTTTDGWFTLGTSDGSPGQVLDCSDYFVGGGGPSDLPTDLAGIQAEMGWTYYWTNGTGTDPVRGQWLYKANDMNNIYGYIWDAGTSSGTGYITTKYTIGTISQDDEITAMGIVEKNGPSMERFWTGTVSGAPEIATNVWTPLFNNRDGGTNGQYKLPRDTASGMTYYMAGGTSITLGDGTWGNIPANGARLRGPGTLFSYVSSGDYTAGTTCNPHATRLAWFSPSYSNYLLELNSVNLSGWYLNTYNASSLLCDGLSWHNTASLAVSKADNMSFNNCVMGAYPSNGFKCMTLQTKVSGGTISNSIISQMHPYSTSYGLNLSNIFPTSPEYFYLKDNMFIMPYEDKFGYVLEVNRCSRVWLDNNIINGLIRFTDLQDCLIDNTKYCMNTGGTETVSYNCISGSKTFGSFKLRGWEHIQDYVTAGAIFFDSACRTSSFTVRNVGSIHKPLLQGGASREMFDIGGVQNGYLDFARIFLDQDINTWSNYLYLGNSVDSQSIYRNILMPDTASHIPRGYNVSLRGVTMDANSTNATNNFLNQLQSGSHWHDLYRENGYGGIYCTFTFPTSISNPYSIISGELVHENNQELSMKAGDIIELDPDYTVKGHTGFTGTVAYFDASTAWNANDWSGTVRTYFQYDTAGTGYNGTWGTVAEPTNWTGLQVDPSIGVKIKLRLECDSDSGNMRGFATATTTNQDTQKDYNSWYTIDQTVTTITLENVVVGSRYYIYDNTAGELLTSGVASTSTVTYEKNNLANGTQLLIRVRYSSGSPKYLPFETFATTSNLAANVYVSQIEDTIAS